MIDPSIHAAQLRVVAASAREVKCESCGARTRDRSGRCRTCRIQLPPMAQMTTAALLTLRRAVETELRRRAQEITDALERTP